MAVLVHEVRSPVAALAAIRETLDAEHGVPEARGELVRLAIAACAAIERIVADAPFATLERARVDVARLLRETATAAEIRGGHVRLLDVAELPEVLVDPVRIRQALDNLVENALAHTVGDDHVLLGARIEGDELVLSVTDAGPGIAAAEHERIFESGVRLGSDYAGSGLGLAVVRAIAAAHEGSVRIRSSPGRGTTISLVLPVRAP